MREVRILTVPLDRRTGLFDDEGLRGYLRDREVLRAEPQFFVHDGQPSWTIYLETRTLRGADELRVPDSTDARAAPVPHADGQAERDAFARLLRELDEAQRARYDGLLRWRRQTAHAEGLPVYVLLTNSQALELARRAPRTLGSLAETKGIGRKRVERHGRAILEVLHGPEPAGRPERDADLRAVDGHDGVALRADEPVPEAPAAQPDAADRRPGAGDS